MASRKMIERGVTALQGISIPRGAQPFGKLWCETIASTVVDAAFAPGGDVAGVVEKARERIRQRVRNAWVGTVVEGAAPADLVEQVASDKTEWRALDTLAAQIASLSAKVAEVEMERDDARREASLGCDANAGGFHSIIKQGSYAFCHKCGETIRAPSMTERAISAEQRATAAEARAECLEKALRKILVADSFIDATPRGKRQVRFGPFATIARAALQQEGE